MAECLAYGWREAECTESIADRMVNGTYCDGTVVLTADGARCVAASTTAQKRAAGPLARPESRPLPTPSWAVPLAFSMAFRALFALSDMWEGR